MEYSHREIGVICMSLMLRFPLGPRIGVENLVNVGSRYRTWTERHLLADVQSKRFPGDV